MGQTSNDIMQHIESERTRLGQNLNDLEDRVKTATDWRHQFEQHPAILLGVAFGGGLLLSLTLFGGNSADHAGE